MLIYSTSYCADGAVYYETFCIDCRIIRSTIIVWSSGRVRMEHFDYRAGNEPECAHIMVKINRRMQSQRVNYPRIIRDEMTSETQALRAIDNYLVKNCVDHDNLLAQIMGHHDAYTAYGCLIEKKAVCQGYAGVFNLLAAKAGICSIAVPGEAGGGSHAWNYVKDGSS